MNKVVHSSVFSWRRNAKYVDDVLTDEDNAFQARAAATGKARSPRATRVDFTSSVDVDPDLRRRRDSTSDVSKVRRWRIAVKAAVYESQSRLYLVLSPRYSTSNNGVTLQSGLGVIQGH